MSYRTTSDPFLDSYLSKQATIVDYGSYSHRELNPYTSINSQPWGTDVRFRVEKLSDKSFLRSLYLETQIAPLQQSGGTTMALCDAAAIFMFNHIRIEYNGMELYRCTDTQMYNMIQQHNGAEEYSVIAQKLGIDSLANRRTAAAGNQLFVLDLDEFFACFQIDLPLFALNQGIDIIFNLKSQSQILEEVTGTNPQVFVNYMKLNTCYVESYSDAVPRYVQQLSKEQWYPIVGYNFVEGKVTLPAGNSGVRYTTQRIGEFAGRDVVYATIQSRLSSDVDTQNGVKPTAFLPLQSYNLQSLGVSVDNCEFQITDSKYRFILLNEYRPLGKQRLKDMNLYMVSYASDLVSSFGEYTQYKRELTGSKMFGQQDVNLVLQSGNNNQQYVSVCIVYRCDYAIRNGEIQRIERTQ